MTEFDLLCLQDETGIGYTPIQVPRGRAGHAAADEQRRKTKVPAWLPCPPMDAGLLCLQDETGIGYTPIQFPGGVLATLPQTDSAAKPKCPPGSLDPNAPRLKLIAGAFTKVKVRAVLRSRMGIS